MAVSETLGVLAHRGGLVVVRPELSVGVVCAVSRPTGLEIELLARRPLDRRSATERQTDIRAGYGVPPVAPRRLLPAFDEGMDLRVGWLDDHGRAHWEFGSTSTSSGDHFEGTNGPSLRTVLDFPPLFDRVAVVLAWPEIGFPEAVVDLALPDRATVERGTVSMWDAPVDIRRAPEFRSHRVAPFRPEEMAVEAGRITAVPRVLCRGDDAAVVLTRLTALGSALSMEILSVARGGTAETVGAAAFAPARRWTGVPDDPEQIRSGGPGASVAVIDDGAAVWLRPHDGSFSGGGPAFRGTSEFMLHRPADGVLDLAVAWPAAGLPDMRVTIPL